MSGLRYVPRIETSTGSCPDCGKQRYISKAAAKTIARQMEARHGDRLQRPYKCGDYWHLTSASRATMIRYREQAHD